MTAAGRSILLPSRQRDFPSTSSTLCSRWRAPVSRVSVLRSSPPPHLICSRDYWNQCAGSTQDRDTAERVKSVDCSLPQRSTVTQCHSGAVKRSHLSFTATSHRLALFIIECWIYILSDMIMFGHWSRFAPLITIRHLLKALNISPCMFIPRRGRVPFLMQTCFHIWFAHLRSKSTSRFLSSCFVTMSTVKSTYTNNTELKLN